MYRSHVTRWLTVSALGLLLAVFGAQILITPKADALTGSQFRADYIIDDFVFTNNSTMSTTDIQNFLNSKVPNCDRWGTQASTHWNSSAGRYYTRAEWGSLNGQPAPYVCLRDYVENPNTKANNLQGAADPAGGQSAAQLIKSVSDQYHINPQVLLILLQKEQSLVTDDWPWTTQYRSATGYGCPDTAPCASQYYGFYNQISNAAWQFNQYASNPTSYGYRAGRTNYIAYNPSSSCGGSNVTISNQSTANLYIYTPYQPNQAALNNLYGSGDSCSAYGNRNFWRMFNDWFGSTYANDTNVAHPNGTIISDNRYVYVLEDGTKRHIATPAIFDSYGYSWTNVRQATAGDLNLPGGNQIRDLAPGTLANIGDGKVYVNTYINGTLQLQWIPSSTFSALGYNWNDVKDYSSGGVLSTIAPGMYTSNTHPAGTLVVMNGGVYVLDQTSLHHVNPAVFMSWSYNWNRVKNATAADTALPVGAEQPVREGSVALVNGSIYVIAKDANGTYKRPFGPWECFQNRMHYAAWNLINTSPAFLPDRTGGTFTC